MGCLSQNIDRVVRSGEYELADTQQLTTYCWESLVEDEDVEVGKCIHSHRNFYLVNDVEREPDNDLGTLGLHCVCNTGIDSIIEVWEASCFCDVCFLNAEGKCKNKWLVSLLDGLVCQSTST